MDGITVGETEIWHLSGGGQEFYAVTEKMLVWMYEWRLLFS